MKLYLIRHGESLDDIEDRFGGFANYPLTENGLVKVQVLAESLKDSEIQKLFTSPYLRAYDAARLISEKASADLEVEMDIRERNTYGFLSGMRKDMAKQYFPKEVELADSQKTADEIDGAEKYQEVVERGQRFLGKLKSQNLDVVGMVSHGKFMDVFQREVLKLSEIYKPSDCGYIIVDLDNMVVDSVVNAKIVE